MFGILMESIVIFRNYGGGPLWLLLYAAAFVFLLLREKTRWKRILLVYVPLVVFLVFLCPLTRKVYVAVFDEGNTYYRLLWMIPFGLTVAYAGVTAFAAHRRAGLVACCALIVLAGKPVYTSVYFSPAQNAYHLPEAAVDLCDVMLGEAGEDEKVYAAFPAEMVHYVRQYDTRFILPFGREMVEPAWDYYNEIYSAMEEADVIDAEQLTALLRAGGFDHLVLRADRAVKGSPEAFGFEKRHETGGYVVYVDAGT